jgi:hypothetical protein
MNRFFAGLLICSIFCSGIYTGCENKSAKKELAKTQGVSDSQTKQSAESNIGALSQSGIKNEPNDVVHRPNLGSFHHDQIYGSSTN